MWPIFILLVWSTFSFSGHKGMLSKQHFLTPRSLSQPLHNICKNDQISVYSPFLNQADAQIHLPPGWTPYPFLLPAHSLKTKRISAISITNTKWGKWLHWGVKCYISNEHKREPHRLNWICDFFHMARHEESPLD